MNKLTFIFALLLIVLSINSCTKDKCTQETTYYNYVPVYLTPEQYKIPVTLESPKPLKDPGKIYFYKNYILINEVREGIHIIDNQNPAFPTKIGFFAIKGNVDMAIMNDKLYADSYTDLVIIDIALMGSPKELFRKENVFDTYHHQAGSNRILSHYAKTESKLTIDCSDENYGSPWFYRNGYFLENNLTFDVKNVSSSSNGAPSTVGQGGSMARFTISHAHLYAIGNREIFSAPILSNGNIDKPLNTKLSWGIETIFPYQNSLFVGANDGLHILDISNPSIPVYKSKFTHARACDPVVVQDDIAYVTLRSGTACQGYSNQLDVLDVKDILNPKLLYTYKMDNPHGLAVDENVLFLCEGKFGLKTFDVSSIDKIDKNKLGQITNVHAWDVIALRNGLLLVIGEDGFLQYDISDPKNLKLLSQIPIQK